MSLHILRIRTMKNCSVDMHDGFEALLIDIQREVRI